MRMGNIEGRVRNMEPVDLYSGNSWRALCMSSAHDTMQSPTLDVPDFSYNSLKPYYSLWNMCPAIGIYNLIEDLQQPKELGTIILMSDKETEAHRGEFIYQVNDKAGTGTRIV